MAETSRQNLITSYGLFWRVEDTEWIGTAPRGSNRRRMLGRRGSRGESLQVADFWRQSGLYVLYGNYGVYYVGIARDGRLGIRIRHHLDDHHHGKWDRFSWFGFREVGAEIDRHGFALLKQARSTSQVKSLKAIQDLEAVLYRALSPVGNRLSPAFGGETLSWQQLPVEEINRYAERLARVGRGS